MITNQVGKKEKSLLLMTQGFPYGEFEWCFLKSEVDELLKKYRLYILTQDQNCVVTHKLPSGLRYAKYMETHSFITVLSSLLSLLFWREVRVAIRDCKRIADAYYRFKYILSFYSRSRTAYKHIKKTIINEHTDIIYTYWGMASTLAAIQLKKEFRSIKVVSRMLGGDFYLYRSPVGWQPFRGEMAKKCDKLLFNSSVGKDYYDRIWGGNTQVLYVGTPQKNRINMIDSDILNIVSCSGLISIKRVDIIIRALAFLPETVRVRWYIIGEGDEKEYLERLASDKLGSMTNIMYFFCGFIPNEKIEEYYTFINPSLFVTTTATEGGAPVSIQEAFAMGIPGIGTNTGGVSDIIINDRTGFLLDVDLLPQDLASAIEKFYNLPIEDKRRMSDSAYKLWEERFDAKKTSAQLCQIFDGL